MFVLRVAADFEAEVYADNAGLIIRRSLHVLGPLLIFGDMGYQSVDPADMPRK